MNQEKVGQLIKNIRKENNLTQDEFAKMFGVTYQAVSKWENGKNIPDISILKEMSKKFNVDINDLLDGNNQPKKNKILYILIGVVILIAIILGIILLVHDHNNFEFKRISTTCSDFKITGSAAYNSENASIYISDITYCGNEDSTVYESITCILYEAYDNTNTIISTCDEKTNINLTNYLKDLSLNADKYATSCKKFASSSLSLEINAVNEDGKTITYKIPLSLQNNC